jgi:TPR repeat protein
LALPDLSYDANNLAKWGQVMELAARHPAWTALAGLLCAAMAVGPARADPHADANAADKRSDYATELSILTPHARKGEAWAQNNLGNLYYFGHGVAKDNDQAVFWYRKAAEQGDKGGEANLGQAYLRGEGVAKDEAVGEAWIRKAADHGDLRAAMLLAARAIPGEDDTSASIAAKAARYRKASDAGDEEARQSLTLLCIWPGAVAKPPDCGQVLVWTRAMAERGNVEAEKQLAQFYDVGQMGLKADAAQAAAWYRKAAEAGDAGAQQSLAMHYQFGQGVPRDDVQALVWTRKAAEQGEELAEITLARAFETGVGAPKDDAEAFRWNRRLADQPIADYRMKVGDAYAFGKGVAKDDFRAYIWLSIALASERPTRHEDDDAETLALESVAANLTAPQVAEAKRRAAAWIARTDAPRGPGRKGETDEP